MNNLMKVVLGIFIILHGLVHVWYVVLAQKLVPFKKEMGWTGESWLIPHSKWLATILFLLSALVFVIGGISFLTDTSYWKPVLIGTCILSSLTLLVFWDGKLAMIVEKGLFGLLINIGIIMFLLL